MQTELGSTIKSNFICQNLLSQTISHTISRSRDPAEGDVVKQRGECNDVAFDAVKF